LPERTAHLTDTSPRVFTAHLHIPEDSFADGCSVSEVVGKTDGAMKISRIERGAGAAIMPLPDALLVAGDRLRINDTPERLKEYEQVLGARLYANDVPVDEDHPLTAEDQQLAEVVVVQGSPLEGRSLRGVRFADRYQLITLAVHRAGRSLTVVRSGIEEIVLRTGDVLLVQGAQADVAELKRGGELLVLDATADLPHTAKAPLALGIMVTIVAAAALGILPIAISAVCGALLMVLTGCLDWRNATQALSAQVILIVVASLALGSALLQTGGAAYLADVFVLATEGLPAMAILSGLILLMAILTNVVSNNAAAVIGTPVAVGIAHRLGLPPEAFVLAVLFGANMSYATPMAYKTNLLVMNAGGYRFTDFVRVGVPLTLIMWLVFSWLLPTLYPL